MFENGSVFYKDPYSFAAGGVNWTNMEWLTQIIFYLVYAMGGARGLILLKFFVLSAVFFPFVLYYFRKRIFYFAWFILVSAIIVAEARYMIRPQIFSLLFVSLFLFSFFEFRYRKNKDFLLLLPVIQLFWVNMHGYFVLGILFVLLFFLGEYFSVFLKRRFDIGDDVSLQKKELCFLRNVGFMVIVVSFASPYGLDAFMYPFKIFNQLGGPGFIKGYIKELSPIIESYAKVRKIPFFYFNLLFILTAFSFCINVKKIKPVLFFIFAGSLHLAFSMVRHVDLFAVISMWICARNFEDVFDGRGCICKSGPMRLLNRIISSGLINFCLLVPVFYFCFNAVNKGYYFEREPSRFGAGILEPAYPGKALNFLEQNKIKGKIFSNFSAGPYLIWKLYPERVFIDGRTEIYFNSILEDYVNFNDSIWRLWNRVYAFDVALIQYGFVNTEKIIFILYNDPDWQLVYMDECTCVFVKKETADKEFLLRNNLILEKMNPVSVKLNPAFESSKDIGLYLLPYISKAQILRKFKFYDAAIEFYNEIVKKRPDRLVAYNNMASVYVGKLDFVNALRCINIGLKISPKNKVLLRNKDIIRSKYNEYKNVLEKMVIGDSEKKSPEFFKNMAIYYEKAGWDELAAEVYERGIAAYADYSDFYIYLGALFYRNGRYVKAQDVISDGIRKCDVSDDFYITLGVIKAKLGMFNESVECFEEAVKLNKENPDIYYDYGLIYAEQGQYDRCRDKWMLGMRYSNSEQAIYDNIIKMSNIQKHENFLKKLYISY